MAALTRLLRRMAFLLRSGRHADDFRQELEDHRARIQAALEADGVAPGEAAQRSRRAMGNVTLASEDGRDVWINAVLQRWLRDLRYGLRTLRREPTFAATAFVTLTLGIAAASTVFTVADTELWRPLPFPQAHQLLAVHAMRPGANGETERVSIPDFLDWQAQSSLAEYAAEGAYGRRVLRRGGSEYVTVQAVTDNYFHVLRHSPRIGRGFVPAQDGRRHAAVLSDSAWRRLFYSDPGVVGRVLSLDGEDYSIVGVNAGQYLELGTDPDVFVALDLSGDQRRDRYARSLSVLGRLGDDVDASAAEAELETVIARIAAAYPQDHQGHRVALEDLRLAYSGFNWRPLYLFLSASGLLLVLSCLNVTGLLLARALRRQREFAIRGALGGGRRALAGQLLAEGAVLAVPGAMAGVLLSTWALKLFATQIPADYLARGGHFGLDIRVALFATAIAIVTTLLVSVAPALFARRVDLNGALGQSARTAGQTPRQNRLRAALVTGQLALTLVLAAGAALFALSFARLLAAPVGFDARDRMTLRVTLTGAAYGSDDAIRTFADALLTAAHGIAGVASAAVDSSSALDSGPVVRLAAADRTRPAAGDEERAILRAVSPDYFRTLEIALRAGRPFTATDDSGAPRAAIINEYLAARLFGGESAVGRYIDLVPGARTPWTRRPGLVLVVGVASNVKDVGINEVEFGNLYLPFAQAPPPSVELVVHSAIPPGQLTQPLRAAVAGIDPLLPVSRVQTMSGRVDRALQSDRLNTLLIGAFAVIAIVLAAVGVYGTMACAVQERTREFGVRLALGQSPVALFRSALWESARLGCAAGAIGLFATIVIARLLGSSLYLVRGAHNGLLYGVTTTDPLALGIATVVLIVVAALSGVVPARQTSRIDPMIALRHE